MTDPNIAKLVVRIVCEDYEVTEDELKGRSKPNHIVWARHCAIFLIKKFSQMTNARTGAVFNRDHSSVTYVVNETVPNETDTNPSRKMQLFQTQNRLINALRVEGEREG